MARHAGGGCRSVGGDGLGGAGAPGPALGGTLPRRAGPNRPTARPAGRPQAGWARAAAADPGAGARRPGAWCHWRRLPEGRLMPAPDAGVVAIKVAFAVRKRGGRKLVLTPDGAPFPPQAPQVDSTQVK